MTVRVLEVLDDDVRVLVLTGRGRVLKRPHQTGVIRLSAFGTSMKPTTIPEVMKPKTA